MSNIKLDCRDCLVRDGCLNSINNIKCDFFEHDYNEKLHYDGEEEEAEED